MEVLVALVFLASLALAILTLLTALRWPLIRGKHILCAALAIELAGRLISLSPIVLTWAQPAGSSLFQVIGVLSFLSQTLGAVLMLVFVLVMRAELRGLLAGEEGHEAE